MKMQVFERLSEPSTYAGMSVVVALFGVSAEEWQAYSVALSGVFAVVAMLLREGPRERDDACDWPAPLPPSPPFRDNV